MKKTIFITSFHGLVSRVLESGILRELEKSESVQIVIFVPDFKKDYFQERFGNFNNITIEGVKKDILPKRADFFQKLSFVLLDTRTMKIIRKSFRGYNSKWKYIVAQSISTLGGFRFIRELFRAVNYYFSGESVLDYYFEKYNPNLVFTTDIKHIFDAQFVLEARKRKILTIGMVRSWDYLTAKGIVRMKPDMMIVHNEIIKEEAIKYADMKEKDIFVSGLPHFDPYTNETRISKKEFYKKISANSKKRLIFLSPVGDKFADIDWIFFEILDEAIKQNELPNDLQVLVRVPPGDTLDLSKFDKSENIIFDYPGIQFGEKYRKENEMSYGDLLHLADSIYHSELVVTGPSTIVIDGAVFGKPIIFLNFDGTENKPYYPSNNHYYDFNHMQNITKTFGTSNANNGGELIFLINQYLNDPNIKNEERRRIVREQGFKLDGNASKRVVDFLLTSIS
ncbi:MAG: CDP-glycerol glycerophosphotransferase family protein [SAR202 cluster bacterium]|nr:CDP-glycerol glycerophosphotransferase family protein [SAR202 cluster bacterium]